MDNVLGLEPARKMTAMERHCERQHNTQCLFFMGTKMDADDNVSLVLPIRSDRGENIQKAGTITAQNAAFAEAIDDTMATLYTSETHFLVRAADLHSSNLTDLQIALLTQWKLCKTPLTSLDAAATNKSSWTAAYFIPVSLSTDADADNDNDERIAEQVLGEEKILLTKIKAINKINRHIDSLSMVLCFLGNCYCLPQISFDVKSVKPIFSQCVEEVGHCLTEPNIRRWFERACLREGGYHLPWAVFNIIEQVSSITQIRFPYEHHSHNTLSIHIPQSHRYAFSWPTSSKKATSTPSSGVTSRPSLPTPTAIA